VQLLVGRMEDIQDEIKCIFFSEFHPTAGPMITYQVPDKYISREVFDAINVYIITKPELQGRTITINSLGHKIVGCPVCIEDKKYSRNAFIFNLCFVFLPTAATKQYEEVVKKLADYLTTLEKESEFLSSEKSRSRLPEILELIMEELNQLESCTIPINESTKIYLKVVPSHVDPVCVESHDVPIINRCQLTKMIGHWDLATQQLLPYMDGFKHVARIAIEADVDINIVKACVQNLCYHGAIKLISVFQYSNVYMPTPEINTLASDEEMQTECVNFVATSSSLPLFKDIFPLYASLTPGLTVRDLCARHNPHTLGINERKLIQFGLMTGVIRRLKKYPIKLANEAGSSKMRDLYRWFNGQHSYDEICTLTGQSYQELDSKVESDSSIVVCWK